MKKRLLHYLAPLFGVLVLTVALAALHHIFHRFSYRQIAFNLESIPTSKKLLAVLLTLVSYLLLTGYDTLGMRYIQHPLRYSRIALASFLGYAFNNNIGFAGLAGNSLRYRIYTTWGLSAFEIAKVIGFCIMTFWIGFLTVGGLVFVIDPIQIPPNFPFPLATLRPLGVVFLLIVMSYFGWIRWKGRTLRFREWEFNLPSPRFFFAQMALSSLDWLAAAGVFYVLLPAQPGFTFTRFVGFFLFAQIAGLVSHVPGGVGVFETVMALCLNTWFPPPVIAGVLVAYRALYYLLPLGLAAVLLGAHEAAARLERVKQTAGILGAWARAVVPNVFAFTTFVAGAILLFSGAVPGKTDRLAILREHFHISIIETSHVVASMVGAGLLLLARGIQRRLDAAYFWTMISLAAGIAFSLLKDLDYEEALILTVLLVAFIPCRAYFYRRASLRGGSLSSGWVAAILITLVGSLWLGFFSFKHVPDWSGLWLHFSLQDHRLGEAARFLRASVGAIGIFVVFSLYLLLRRGAPQLETLGEEAWARVRAIVQQSPRTYPWIALLRDKRILFSESGQSFIMYGIEGRSWVALGDPVGREEEMQELVWQFRELSDRHDGWTVFYHVLADRLPLYLDLGLVMLKLGEEALVPLAEFSLEGSARRSLRHSWNRVSKEGCHFEMLSAAQVAALLPELKSVSDDWLTAKSTREKGFSLGAFDPAYLQECPLALVRQHGRLIAFANLWSGAGKEELSIDMMRYRPEMHAGVMDYLFIELMLWGQREGYRWFNLGMAPLSGLENRALAPLWIRIGAMVYHHGEHFYNFQGLRLYKEKFDPLWVPKYLASPGGIALPRVLANVAALIAGGVKGIVGK